MTSQIPFTPLTPGSVERLTLDEALAFEAATVAVANDQKPSLEVVATLVLAVHRLITEAAGEIAAAERERIAELADGRRAHYPADGIWASADLRWKPELRPFADLIREPQERSDDKEGRRP